MTPGNQAVAMASFSSVVDTWVAERKPDYRLDRHVTGSHLRLEVHPAGGDPTDPFSVFASKGLPGLAADLGSAPSEGGRPNAASELDARQGPLTEVGSPQDR